MAPRPVFVKELTATDINHRLCFPTEHLDILPRVAYERDPVEFHVNCGNQEYVFRCIKRQKNEDPQRPVIERGWHDVVRRYGVQAGDFLEFYMEASDHEDDSDQEPVGYSYRIEVHRRVGHQKDEMGDATFWQRII